MTICMLIVAKIGINILKTKLVYVIPNPFLRAENFEVNKNVVTFTFKFDSETYKNPFTV